jgi:UDP-2,4-diacetamido-2,4,6-trideoxy-beta-L-altropyranose hydrolase
MGATNSGRLAVRCDGGVRVGAGHVGRCLPLARAFSDRGWSVSFVGSYEGLAASLLDRAGYRPHRVPAQTPCGLAPEEWDAAIVDSYAIQPDAICALAGRMPIATLGEASRCETSGVLIDYHLDRAGEEPDRRLLPGPRFAPLDPAFAGAGRAGREVGTVLVTMGGSELAADSISRALPAVRRSFPSAELLLAGGHRAPQGTRRLPSPTRLLDVVDQVDLAVSAAGLTAYELACAGIPQVAVAIVSNQARVAAGLRRSGLAPCLDLCAGDSLDGLGDALEQLQDPDVRAAVSELGRSTFDGAGAARAAEALIERFQVA